MSWLSSTIDPSSTTPAGDIGKIKNDLAQLRAVLAGTSDGDIPVSIPATWGSFLQAGSGSVQQILQDAIRNACFHAKSFGVKADGTTDDTTAVQNAINAAAALGLELIFEGPMLVGLISTAANDVRLVGRKGARFIQKAATYAANSWHVSLTGDRPYVRDITFDGNQAAMTAGQGSGGLLVGGKSPTMIGVTAKSYNGIGCQNSSNNGGLVTGNVKGGTWIDCHFDDNAGLGMQTTAASYHTFAGCTWDRNGYGFQKTRATYADTSHGFVAFGAAIRMRSHHLTFIGGAARDNGREGLNVNQGSYAIKFLGVLCHGNDDGGFTLAADNTSSGLPGEGEACFDVEYTDCEAYNNFGSGLVAYQPAHNISVIGGRYYNNNRSAGFIPNVSSAYNGIYFAAGSTGINVDAKCYDDRQFRAITAVSGSGTTRTLTATSWFPGSMLYYPRVAIYAGTDQSFLGYGVITAESAGSVTISSAANNGVTLASLAAGMYVAQAVQHNGVLVDNGCQGQLHVDGFGHHKGVDGFSGRNVCATYFGNNTNILLPKMRRNDVELLVNPTFDAGITSWAFSNPTGGSATAYSGTNRRSAGALVMVGGTSTFNFADPTLIASAQQAMLGEFVEFGVWVFANSQGDANILLYTQSASINSIVVHPGGGWKYLKVGLQVSPTDTACTPRLVVAQGKTAYFDSASFRAIDLPIDNREFAPISRSLPI